MIIVFLAATHFLPGIRVASFWIALLAVLALIFVNLFIKPVFSILKLPFNILTVALFTFAINAGIILLFSAVVSSFVVEGFLPALYLALIMVVVKTLLF
jgi:putative membrane protein